MLSRQSTRPDAIKIEDHANTMLTEDSASPLSIIEKEYVNILDIFHSKKIITGFTKPILEGDPSRDIDTALLFTGKRFAVAYMKQVHGAAIAIVDGPGVSICDGIFTSAEGLALVVKTADCMPLVFYSEKDGVIGVVHMGWRSAKEGILDNIPYDLDSFKVAVGVGMRTCCYEVGIEFSRYDTIKPHLVSRDGRHYFNPVSFAKSILVSNGLKERNFFDIGICSYCSEKGFFSHRKSATPNRTLTFIAQKAALF